MPPRRKVYSPTEISRFLSDHKLWLNHQGGGMANPIQAKIAKTVLKDAELSGAIMEDEE